MADEHLTHQEILEELRQSRARVESLVNRLAGAVELLCKKSGGLPGECPHCGEKMPWLE